MITISRMLLFMLYLAVAELLAGASSGTSTNVNFVFAVGSPLNTTPCASGAGCSGTASVPGTTSQMTYNSFGVANYGILGAFSQGSIIPGIATSGSITMFGNINSSSWF